MKLYVCHLKTVVLFYLAQPREKGKEVIFMDFIDMPLLQMLMLAIMFLAIFVEIKTGGMV